MEGVECRGCQQFAVRRIVGPIIHRISSHEIYFVLLLLTFIWITSWTESKSNILLTRWFYRDLFVLSSRKTSHFHATSMKITSNAQCLFCQLWCFVRNMFLLRATISLSFFHPPLGNLNSTCVLTVTNTDTNIRLHSRVLIMSSGRTIVSDDDGAGSWLWECQCWSWLAPRHRQEHGHPPPADHWSPPHMVRWPHRPLTPRHTVSRCTFAHLF